MSKKVLLYSLVAAIGGALFGFDTAVINGALPFFTDYFNLDGAEQGWSVTSALIGCIIGALLIGKPGDKYGRKRTLIVMGTLFLISAVGTGAVNNFNLFLIFRFIGGLAVGGASVISPTYIAEIAPPKYRGRLTATFQLAIVLGILLAFFSDYLLLALPNNWRWMFIAEAVPALLFIFALLTVDETPRWLIKVGRVDEAKRVLTSLDCYESVSSEVKLIEDSLKIDKSKGSVSILNRRYRKSLLIALAFGMFNQFTGIGVVMYYATDIFRSVGFDTSSAIGQTVLVGFVNLLFTFLGITFIDKIGRKKLLLIGTAVMSLFLAIFSFAYLSDGDHGILLLVSLMLFIAGFASSQGVVIWVVLAELFPTEVRSTGVSIGSFSHWAFNGIISFSFPVVREAFPNGIGYFFIFFAAMTLCSYFFFRKTLYETGGKSLEELAKEH